MRLLVTIESLPSIPNRSQEYLEIRGARVHNLKNVHLRLPHNRLILRPVTTNSETIWERIR